MDAVQETKKADVADPPAKDVEVEAIEKLNAGKRNLACDEYPEAVDALTEACELLAAKYGEEADELAECYFYYGKALLELARMENGVLGNALDGVPAEEENEADLSESDQFEKASAVKEDEREDVRKEIYTAMSAEEKEQKKQDDASAENEDNSAAQESTKEESTGDTKPSDEAAGDAETKEGEKDTADAKNTDDAKPSDEASGDAEVEKDEDTADDNSEKENQEMSDEEGDDDTTSSQDDANENADDVPNLQLSWEVLELSKKIYIRQVEENSEDKSIKIKLSDVYRILGEVSMETGSPDQSVNDFNSCLELQLECLQPDSRFIAETHYQLGNSYLLGRNYSRATDELRKAKLVIETRIGNLSKQIGEAKDDKQASEKLQKEHDNLKQLLPDIIAKVEDVEDESRNAERAETEVKAAISSGGTTTIGFGTSSESAAPAQAIPVKKANDISNLVRKRKPEDPEPQDVKKAKSNGVDGLVDKENGQSETSPVDNH